VLVNIGHGQNGFLTAALLGGALHWLDRRPLLAGVLIGLLAYKPQFGVLIPLALLANGRWSSIGAAAATVAALVAVSYVTLGSEVWHAFANSTTFTRTVVLEQGGTGWEKIQSIFSAARMWGGRRAHRLCRSDRAGARTCCQHRTTLAQRRRLRSQGLGAGDREPARNAPMFSITTWLFWRCRSRFLRATASLAASRLRDQPAGGGLGDAAVLARHHGRQRHPAGLLVMLGLYAATLRRATMDRSQSTVPAGRVAQA